MTQRKPLALLKPAALAANPVVAVVAPASDARPERLDAGAAAAAALGWQLRFMPHARGRHAPFFSASAEDRVADLHSAFADPGIDAILCTRGGYGTNYLLPLLDLDLIAAHPKPLLGYSDLTAIQTWLLDQTGLVTLSAPMLAADFFRADGVDQLSLQGVLGGDIYRYGGGDGLRTLREGDAEGTLYGGCLTLLAASLGTPYAAQTEGKLLLLEDVSESPYKVDRMLRQLLLAGKLEGVQGYIFGEMPGCGGAGENPVVEEAILHALRDVPGPIAIGLRTGHVTRGNVTLPLGVRGGLHAGREHTELLLLEAAMQRRTGVRS